MRSLSLTRSLEALRFKRIDELLSQYGKESETNQQTIKRVHSVVLTKSKRVTRH